MKYWGPSQDMFGETPSLAPEILFENLRIWVAGPFSISYFFKAPRVGA